MPGSHRDWDIACKIFIGGLRDDANKYDIEDAFSKFGKVVDVWVARKPPGFAFVEMDDPRDAEDASKELDGTRICGAKCRVEMSDPGRRRGRGGRGRSRSGEKRSRSRSPRRSRRSPSYGERKRSPRRSPSYGRKASRSPKRERSNSRRRRSPSNERKRSVSRDRKRRSRSRS